MSPAYADDRTVKQMLESGDPVERTLASVATFCDFLVENEIVDEPVPLIIVSEHPTKGTAVLPLNHNGRDVLVSLVAAYCAVGEMTGLTLKQMTDALHATWGERERGMARAGRRNHRPSGARGRGKRAR